MMNAFSAPQPIDKDNALVLRIIQRYIGSPGVISMAVAKGLTKRASEWSVDRHLPILGDLQRRISPESWPNWTTLTYAWPNARDAFPLSLEGNQKLSPSNNSVGQENHLTQATTSFNQVTSSVMVDQPGQSQELLQRQKVENDLVEPHDDTRSAQGHVIINEIRSTSVLPQSEAKYSEQPINNFITRKNILPLRNQEKSTKPGTTKSQEDMQIPLENLQPLSFPATSIVPSSQMEGKDRNADLFHQATKELDSNITLLVTKPILQTKTNNSDSEVPIIQRPLGGPAQLIHKQKDNSEIGNKVVLDDNSTTSLSAKGQALSPITQTKSNADYKTPIFQHTLSGSGRLIQRQEERSGSLQEKQLDFNGFISYPINEQTYQGMTAGNTPPKLSSWQFHSENLIQSKRLQENEYEDSRSVDKSVHKRIRNPIGQVSPHLERIEGVRFFSRPSQPSVPAIPNSISGSAQLLQTSNLPVGRAYHSMGTEACSILRSNEPWQAKDHINNDLPPRQSAIVLFKAAQQENTRTIPVNALLQRTASDRPSSTQAPKENLATSASSKTESKTQVSSGYEGFDLEHIADEVYRIIERRLTIEREILGL